MKRLIVLVVAIGFFVLLAMVVRENASIEHLAEKERQLRRLIVTHPWSAFFGGLILYYLVSLVPGTSGKSIVMGWLYGVGQGVVIVVVALTAAAVTQLLLSRYLLRELVQHRFYSFVKRLDARVDEEGAFYLLTLRMLHVPFTLVNYGAGATSIDVFTFAWTTAIGLLPGTIIFVFLGSQFPTLHDLAAEGPKPLLNPLFWLAFLAMGAFPLIARTSVRFLRRLMQGRCENSTGTI